MEGTVDALLNYTHLMEEVGPVIYVPPTKAAAATKRGVLVENHIEGLDFRIAIFGGRFAWATKRMPAFKAPRPIN